MTNPKKDPTAADIPCAGIPSPDGVTQQTQHLSGTPPGSETLAARVPVSPETVSTFPPMIASYVVEGELGRGGMGVVYKARQKGLGRLVAIKMIRDAALAGPADRIRFKREAASLAQLHH